jgi:hypothetical protein
LFSNHSPDFLQVGHLMIGFGFIFGFGGCSLAKAGGPLQDGIAAVRMRPSMGVLFQIASVRLPSG